VNLHSLYDNPPGAKVDDPATLRGTFQSSHVEVKLAVYGIMILLRMFGIIRSNAQAKAKLTLKMLKQLRKATWEDGTRPAFEIYFSRKYCNRCKKLVRRLQQATNIRIDLLWKPRLRELDHVSELGQAIPRQEQVEGKAWVRGESETSVAENDTESPYFETVDKPVQEPLQTIEENGIIYYLPKQGNRREAVRSTLQQANINKPLPPTAENEPPYWYNTAVEERSPGPYCMRLN
jgi:hypothetical protein